jgi:hypothetical protein
MTLFDEVIYETTVRMFDPGMIVVPYTASGRVGLRCWLLLPRSGG